MKIRTTLGSIALLAVAVETTAYAADCGNPKDLVARKFSDENERIQQVILARLKQKTYQQAVEDYGVEVIYKNVPITATATTYEAFQHASDQFNYSNLLTERSKEIIASYGDKTLVDAYKACIRSQGAVTVEALEFGNTVTMRVRYEPSGRALPATIKSLYPTQADIDKNNRENRKDLQGVTLLHDECKTSLTPGGICQMIYSADRPGKDMVFTIDTDGGAATAYFPPRIDLVQDTTPIPQKYRVLPYDYDSQRPATALFVEAPGGNITTGHACTGPLPTDSFILVDVKQKQPRVATGFPPGHFGTHKIGRLTTPDGVQKEVCFDLDCGNAGGGKPVCEATLEGNMTSLVWKATTLPPDVENARLNSVMSKIQELRTSRGRVNK